MPQAVYYSTGPAKQNENLNAISNPNSGKYLSYTQASIKSWRVRKNPGQ